jgi:hypothetical protein
MNAFLAEASILKQLRHTKIVQFLGLFKNKDGIFMVTEFSKYLINVRDKKKILAEKVIKNEQTPNPITVNKNSEWWFIKILITIEIDLIYQQIFCWFGCCFWNAIFISFWNCS